VKKNILAIIPLIALSIVPAVAEEKILTAPFPSSPIWLNDSVVFCKASLGTLINGRSKAYEERLKGLNAKAGIEAKVHTATDSIVLEIQKNQIFVFRQDEYEKGNITRENPLTRIPDIEKSLSATSTGIGGATFVSLNRDSGVASLTQIMSMGMFSDGPRIESIYFLCSSKKH
jgi:hypothetical protein